MKTISVSLKHNPYKIHIGKNILKGLGRNVKSLNIGTDAVLISSPVILKLHGRAAITSLKKSGFTVKVFAVPDGEKSKSAPAAFKLIEAIARYDVLKKSFIVALGGGVVGDLAGFVASVYKRGLPYVQVPTTLLAQIDSAIGGKVAVDLSVGKNLVGSFYQPKMVFSDMKVLTTLDLRQIRNGLAEAVKYGVIYDEKFFSFLEKNVDHIQKLDLNVLTAIVHRCSQIKTEVVLADEKETKGIRTILNFGHTIGHAVEAAGGYSLYHHGESVALGMRAAARLSMALGMLSSKDGKRLDILLDSVGLPQKIRKVSLADILHLMQHDKKFQSGKNRFVLASKIGKVKVVEGVPASAIHKAIRACQ